MHNSFIQASLPKNINCQFASSFNIELSTTISLPKGFRVVPNEFTSFKTRRVRINFSISPETPFNKLYATAHSEYLKATKSLRLEISRYHLNQRSNKYLSILREA